MSEQDFSLEDIIKEFSDTEGEPVMEPDPQPDPDSVFNQEQQEEPAQEDEQADFRIREDIPEGATETTVRFDPPVTGDTIRIDKLREQIASQAEVADASPIEDEEPEEPEEEPFTDRWEPEYEQPMGEYVPPQPIAFRPRSRLRELKRALVEGPEKQYYELVDKGLGKLQIAIFISVVVALLSGGATVLYACGLVQENRMRLMVFGQFLAMLISALLCCYEMIDGVSDLLHKRFTLKTLLAITFIACTADGIFCLGQLRVPCCAAFSLEACMALWSRYQQTNTRIGQLDTMRKAIRLDSLTLEPDYYDGLPGLLRGEGQVEDFMDRSGEKPDPDKAMDLYGLIALCISGAVGIAGGVLAGLRSGSPVAGISGGIQTMTAALLCALPATAFIITSRPMAVLERKMHHLGTVLCGWSGVKALGGKAVFPIRHGDLFPTGSIKMNGVKFFGEMEPDEVVACCTALVCACGSGLAPLFVQVLDSRNGNHYDAENVSFRENGSVSGTVAGESVLIGTLSMLRSQGVESPEGLRVDHALCVAIGGELSGLFALSYDATVSATAGLSTLCSYRGLNPVLTATDFMVNDTFIREKFGVRTRRILFPPAQERGALDAQTGDPEKEALLLTTKDGFAPFAYGVTGARSLYQASRAGKVVHMIGGGLGMAAILTLAILGALELVSPVNMMLYQLIWCLPGFLITEWTRSL